MSSEDNRFNAMHSASTFKPTKKENTKVKVDDRFKSVLSDDRFQSVPGQVDKYGRKSNTKEKKKRAANELKEFYDIDNEENEEETAQSAKPSAKPTRGGVNIDTRLDYLNKLARGECSDDDSNNNSSDSSSSGDEDDEDDESSDSAADDSEKQNDIKQSALQIPNQAEPEMSSDVSCTRIAIQNCDWENLSAEDIM
jgi:hypothetical protein